MNRQRKSSEPDVLTRLREGDELAFRTIFERFYVRLCVFADRYLNDGDASKDIVNDVFVKLWNGPKKFDHLDHLLASLYLTTKNTALNYLLVEKRAVKRNLAYQTSLSTDVKFYLAEIIRTEVCAELYEAISKLPEKAGRIIRETYLEGKSNKEVADAMGITLQTLRNQKSRALAILRRRLAREHFELLTSGALMVIHFPYSTF